MNRVSNTKPVNTITEQQQQQRVIKWAQEHSTDFPELNLLYHVPNERKCTPRQGRQLKLAGVRSGVPDLCLPVARGKFHGLYLEMKTEGGRVSSVQRQWLDDLTAQGYKCHVCYSWVDAVEILQEYLAQVEAVTKRRE